MRFLPLLAATLVATLTVSAQVPDYVPTDGLVAWYPFNGNANDESSFANHGTVVGATLTTDRFGLPNRAYNFDGNDHIEAPHQDWLNTGTGSKTWAGWGRKTSGNDHAHFLTKIVATSGPYSATNVFLRYAPGEWIEFSEGQSGVGGNGVAIQSNSLLNQWVHLTGVKDANNGTTRIYQNGVLMNEATMQNPQLSFDNSGPLFIGCEHPYVSLPSGPQYFFGDLDDLGIWSRALSETEVTALFTGIAPVPGCNEETACNYDTDANVNDGSCIPSGCMEVGACNYNADAECEGEACDYSCCPGPGCCGDGMHWDADAQTCVITPPSVAPDAECTLMNLQELAEGYQILLAENAELDSLFADCNGTNWTSESNGCNDQNSVNYYDYHYDIAQIGNQCWFAENLQTAQFRNGDTIPVANPANPLHTMGQPARAAYNYDENNVSISGWIYNGFVAIDNRGVCPSGWSVPTDEDYKDLERFIGMTEEEVNGTSWRGTDQAQKLKSSPTDSPSWNGTNTTGFSAIPAGVHFSTFSGGNQSLHLWCRDGLGWNSDNYYRAIESGGGIFRLTHNIADGHSIRCLRD